MLQTLKFVISTWLFLYLNFDHHKLLSQMLQTQVFRVGQVNEPCIGLTQENSIENSVQDGLPYILNSMAPADYF